MRSERAECGFGYNKHFRFYSDARIYTLYIPLTIAASAVLALLGVFLVRLVQKTFSLCSARCGKLQQVYNSSEKEQHWFTLCQFFFTYSLSPVQQECKR